MISENLRNEWTKCINEKFPGIRTHFVSTFDASNEKGTKNQKRYVHATGVVELLEDIRSFSKDELNLADQWDRVITSIKSRIGDDQNQNTKVNSKEIPRDDSTLFTIGFIGQPNVGKSSLINSIMGRKVVSASRTPGHTKHFQTLHLSHGIRVCDSPGLVFPSIIDKNLQILSGLYNISQVKDPYGPVLYLSERLDMFKILNINRSQDPDQPNSVFYLCEEFALKCGFLTSKAGRPDTYRAANFILRQVIDGKILLNWTPIGFQEDLCQNFCKNLIFSEESEDDCEYLDSDTDEDDCNNSDSEEDDFIENFESKSRFSVFNELSE